MSFLALSWALDQKVARSSAKLLLIAMADCVSENKNLDNLICFPSNAFLADRTGLDRKSVQANIQWLFSEGFIEKTGEARGRTKQVTEYRLKEPKSGHLSSVQDSPKGTQISPESSPDLDTFADDERCPNFPAKVPKFPAKGAQISAERCPNLGHGTSNEPIKEPVKEPVRRAKSSFNAAQIDLPEWLPREAWAMWAKDRADRRKPITQAGARMQLKDLERYRNQGHDPVTVIEHSISRGWQGLFPPREEAARTAGTGRKPSSHSGFDKINYSEGIDENGYIIG